MRLYLLVNKIQPIGRITEQDQSVPFCCFFDNSNTNKKIIFLPFLLDILTCHTIQFENQKNCVLDIYITRWQNVAVFCVDISFNTTWLTGQWILLYYRSYLLSREEMKKKMNCEIPNCVFGACFAHKKYTKQKNTDHDDVLCFLSKKKNLEKIKSMRLLIHTTQKSIKKTVHSFFLSLFILFFSSSII